MFEAKTQFNMLSVKKVNFVAEPGLFLDIDTTDTTQTLLVKATGGYWGILDSIVTDADLFKERTLSSVMYKHRKVKVGGAVDCLTGSGQILTDNVVKSPATGFLSATTPTDTEIEIYDGQPRVLQTGGRKAGRVIRYIPASDDVEFGNTVEGWLLQINEGA
ncbi:MAG: hypothetical protein COS89_06925 [Deltaproteobacteria bacterium CG07_land_8_20_14_0_80_38_7]|nr:MAG: hypothetical protein COS89_06925 [Deltaproteobacteria bacterium CG07_land_8_20_14_0_80_38_7]